MCLDREWVDWLKVFQNQSEPDVTQIGIGYMLQGGSPEHNSDPDPEGSTPDNQWMEAVPPPLMIVVPDLEVYEDLPTDTDNGGPWVMRPDTAYAHIVVPTAGKEE